MQCDSYAHRWTKLLKSLLVEGKFTMNCTFSKYLPIALLVAAFLTLLPFCAYGDEQEAKYYLGESVNAGLDTGFSETNPIDKSDPHFGWELGRFTVRGYADVVEGDAPVFLKNAGDKVKLSFNLEQPIDSLNGDSSLSITEDTKGYDMYFGIPESNFGQGMLIVQKTDSHNNSEKPVMYADYLKGCTVGSDTDIDLFDEGDYEVALDYELRSPGLLGNPILPALNNYRIYFEFKVRNSNAMAFLFDSETNSELFNGYTTPNGFKIDLAGSRYLNVSVKREILNDTETGLIEDTRFNKSANDGDVFTDPGIYTITVANPESTEDPTIKRVYVGDSELLATAVANSLSITEAKEKLAQRESSIGKAPAKTRTTPSEQPSDKVGSERSDQFPILRFVLPAIILIAILGIFALVVKRRKAKDATMPKSVNATLDPPDNCSLAELPEGESRA